MKKQVLFVSVILLSLFGITFLGYSMKFFNLGLTGNTVLSLPQNLDCSTTSAQAVWDSVFKESSADIYVYTTTSSGRCTAYSAYKNNSNELYLLRVIVNASNQIGTTTYVAAIYANVSDAYLQGGAYKTNISADLSATNSLSYIDMINTIPLNLSSVDLANTPFTAKFKAVPTSWMSALSGVYEMTSYFFNETNTTSTKSIISSGLVSANYSFMRYVYNETSTGISCTPSWKGINTTCANNSLTTWFNDTNQCKKLYNLTSTVPANLTVQCGTSNAVNNNILGNDTTITKRNLNIQVYINNALTNFATNYTGQYYVDLKENDIKRVSFLHSFTNPLDLRGIIIEKQNSSSNFGYLIVSGLEVSKVIILDKLNSSSDRVCVKNAGILGISDITATCNGNNEYLINCPGNASGFNCTVSGTTFIVSGLTHSGVREIIGSTCASNWTCGNWSLCINNQQTRNCADTKSCGGSVGKPAELQTCGPSCVSNWTCGNWSLCATNGTQNRTCIDKNNCSPSSGKPVELQTCAAKKGESFLKILFYTFLIIIALIAFAVLFFLIKNLTKAEEEAPENKNKVLIKGPQEES